MKIALCLSGFMRTFEQTFPNLDKFLLSKYPEIDIFIHTWNIQDGHQPDSRVNISTINSLFTPKDLMVEKYHVLKSSSIIEAKSYDKARSTNNVLSMYYKIMKCNKMKTKYGVNNNTDYDCVIRMRPDINLKSEFIINKEYLNDINIPKFGDFGGINDQCAYGNSANMNIYSSLFNFIEVYLTGNEMILNPEMLLKYHLFKNNLHINRFDLAYTLLCHGKELDNYTRESKFNFPMYLKALKIVETIVGDKTYYIKK